MNFFCYKNENSQNLWNANTINLTKANKYASLANQTCVAPQAWKQIINGNNGHKIPPNILITKAMAENYNGPSKSKGKRARERVRA